jgi:hypothetical protein
MLLHAIVLDAAMSVADVRARLARYGLWVDPQQPEARAWIEQHAKRTKSTFASAAKRLARDPFSYGVAIRRQWYADILWYSRSANDVLHVCATKPPNDTLLDALNLHEPNSLPPVPMPAPGQVPQQEGVVVDGSEVVAVSTLAPNGDTAPPQAPADLGLGGLRTITRDTTRSEVPPTEIRTWPRLDAPDYEPARKSFDVVVGFATTQQVGVTGGQVIIPIEASAITVDVTVELMADGLDAPDGWSQVMRVDRRDPSAASATFHLIGRDPTGPEPVHLTILEVRYVVGGEVCGTASRPIVIGRVTDAALPAATGFGTPWLAQPATASALTVSTGQPPVDLTIELAKPDRNASNGRYICRLTSPHVIPMDAGPHEIDLGDDAKTFAKSVVDEVRALSDDALIDNLFRSLGDLVSEKLPPAVFDALRAVAKRVAPDPPAVLFVSAEPYVPWELAHIDPPLEAGRPPFLGAQTLLGRWVRDGSGASPPLALTVTPSTVIRIEKPPAQPPSRITVRDMAVMAGFYMAESGLQRLPSAEAEAQALVKNHNGLALAASSQALKQLLDAMLERDFKHIGGAGAVHFAGHGEFDPSRPDSAVMFLSDGKPLSSLLFRSANYGRDLQPLLFLNACMIGIGGQLLGDMGGFPGNCLRGGFGGVLGALWEVDDGVAAEIAMEFWRRALPVDGTKGEPVAAILRDLRAKYSEDAANVPVSTYLSYVYYGHPRLTLSQQ